MNSPGINEASGLEVSPALFDSVIDPLLGSMTDSVNRGTLLIQSRDFHLMVIFWQLRSCPLVGPSLPQIS